MACAQVDQPASQVRSTPPAHVKTKALISHASTSLRLFGHPANSTNASAVGATTNESKDFAEIRRRNLWDHMRSAFLLSALDERAEVQAQIKWYARHQQYLNRTINRAAPYMYYILEQVQQRNLPAELVLLPIMESAYNPFANSNRGAVGLWQLIHSTANGFGVKQDWWYDGRRDIYASTNAALDYLTYLQSFFGGNWLLAIAAYDAGEGGVSVAVRRNARDGKNTDFWSLQLPAETRSYVPRLLALACIINNPSKYSLTLPEITDQPYLQQVDLGTPVNLAQAAKLAGMSLAQLKQLNPGYSHTMTGPNGPYKLLLPIDRIAIFKQNLASVPGLTKTTYAHYKVKKHDTLAGIAKRYNTTLLEICEENHLKSHKAPVGKMLMIPTGTELVKPHIIDEIAASMANSNASPTPAASATNTAANSSGVNSNVVADNTTINSNSQIIPPAQNNQAQVPPPVTAAPDNYTPVADLVGVNADNTTRALENSLESNGESPAKVEMETQAQSQESKQEVVATSKKIIHKVKAGDTLSSIARKYKVKVADLERWNKQKKSKGLKPGAKLVILTAPAHPSSEVVTSKATASKVKVTQKKAQKTAKVATKAKPTKNRYVVRAGDTLSSIARHHGVKTSDLIKRNKLAGNALKPGQQLVISG